MRSYARLVGGWRVIVGVTLLGATSCGPFTVTCARPDERYVLGFARITAADSSLADAYVGAQEDRSGRQEVYVHVQGYPLSSTVLPAPPLAGHVLAARISTAAGGILLRLPLRVDPSSVSEIGTSAITAVSSDLYDATRDALLRGDLMITLETDSTVAALAPGIVAHVESHDWSKSCGD